MYARTADCVLLVLGTGAVQPGVRHDDGMPELAWQCSLDADDEFLPGRWAQCKGCAVPVGRVTDQDALGRGDFYARPA